MKLSLRTLLPINDFVLTDDTFIRNPIFFNKLKDNPDDEGTKSSFVKIGSPKLIFDVIFFSVEHIRLQAVRANSVNSPELDWKAQSF